MNCRDLKFWKIKMGTWQLRVKSVYYGVSSFLYRNPPFRYFFYILTLIKINREYKKNFEVQKEKIPWLKDRPWLTGDVASAVEEKTWGEYEEKIRIELEEAQRGAKEAEELRNQLDLKLEQFTEFLVKNVEYKQAMAYAKRIPEFIDPNDPKGMYENLCKYVDSVMEKHST